jgi:hypothetical protein
MRLRSLQKAGNRRDGRALTYRAMREGFGLVILVGPPSIIFQNPLADVLSADWNDLCAASK